MTAFAKRFKLLRVSLGLTQGDAAEKLGTSKATIIAYELDQKKPSFDMLVKIALAYCISLDELLDLPKARYHFEFVQIEALQLLEAKEENRTHESLGNLPVLRAHV